jgi:DNA-binding CsgD family transcriptional regulator
VSELRARESRYETYIHRLEQRLDEKLLDHDGLADEPEAAAWLVRAALSGGNLSRARAVVKATERMTKAATVPPGAAVALEHARGLLKRDAVALERAATAHRLPRAQASAAEDAAVARMERGETTRAIELLEQSRAGYQSVNAEQDLARIRSRMRSLGVRTNHWTYAERPSFGWGSLTDTERRIVDLVSSGLTNREVAQLLFLSHHTVAFHLRQIFRKVDVSSRVQLTRDWLEQSAGVAEGRRTAASS